MATHTTLGSLFDDIADAIREKTGSNGLIVADNFPSAIEDIDTIGTIWYGEKLYPEYLDFSSATTFTLGWHNSTATWDGTIQYSTNAGSWSTFSASDTITSVYDSSDALYHLYLRGINNTKITGSSSIGNQYLVITSTNTNDRIDCNGSLASLLNYNTTNSNTTLSENYCFASLFYLQSKLRQPPDLPFMTLSTGCYYYMFSSAGIYNTIIKLPALTIPYRAYMGMFCNSQITSIVDLPATYINNYGYANMFYGSHITQAGAFGIPTYLGSFAMDSMYAASTIITGPTDLYLYSTTSNTYVFTAMFWDCASLTSASTIHLQSSGVFTEACVSMYMGCSSLTTPAIFDSDYYDHYVIYNQGCYQMYKDCTALITPMDISAVSIFDVEACKQMYKNCTSLNKLPALYSNSYGEYALSYMFDGCTSLALYDTQSSYSYTWIINQDYTMPYTDTGCFDYMFNNTGNSSLITPEILTPYYTNNQIIGESE